jgi:ubiquinone/menaquinone biosynthesis C-methylase UbiE
MLNLHEIAKKYNCDKLDLGYTQHYEKKFESIRNNVTKILEIGLNTGGSHLMWLDYFPNANVYAIDNRIVYEDKVFDKRTRKDMVMVDGWDIRDKERSFVFRGNQSSVEDLNKFINKNGDEFDIIVDDGGHSMRQQQTSLKILYKYLKSGGIYVIEDLHTSSNQWTELYGYTIVEDGDTLSMTLMEDFQNETDNIASTKHISTEEMLDIRNKLNSCVIETGLNRYQNYVWPTTLSFMDF